MRVNRNVLISLAATVGLLLASGVATAVDIPLKNWPVPAYSKGGGRTALADVGYPGVFIAVTPCRLVDTRGVSFPAATHPPMLVAGISQNWTVEGYCGIPTGASSVSANFTAVNTLGSGFLKVYPQGGTAPTVSTLNYLAGQVVANAAIVPLGSGGGITVVAGVSGTHMIMDVNGYYIGGGFAAPLNSGEFVGFTGTYDGGGLLYAHNSSTSTDTSTSSVRGQINSGVDNQSGVWGEQQSGTGVNYGVKGTNASTTNGAVGVYGIDGSGAASGSNNLTAGVMGSSHLHIGVEGITDSGAGVRGEHFNGSGTFVSLGLLGYGNYGVWATGDFGGTGAKYFVEPHPTDPSKIIRYIALEGPESGTYFRGKARTVGGIATLAVPNHFRMVSAEEGMTVSITPVGQFTPIWVESVDLNSVVVRSNRDVEFHYIVYGVRRAFKGFEPIVEGEEFAPWSPKDVMAASLPDEIKRRLVANGIYNADGTVNMQTAERMGWARKWRDEERARQDAARHPLNRFDPPGGNNAQ
jgi:hypothetical protein